MKKIAIVTGASSGMGREFASQIPGTRDIDEIWLVARRRDKLEALAEELSASGAIPKIIDADLSGRAGIKRLEAILEKESSAAPASGEPAFAIDALVNNAGFGTYGTFRDTDLDRQLDMIDLNVLSLTGLCHIALPYLRRGSLIVNVASLASFAPLGNFAVYAATKAYVLSFSMALAAELADDGIFVIAACPGPVDTEFAQVASNGARERVVDGKAPAAVVERCLRDAARGRHVSIMAPKWRFKAFMSRFIGRFAFARHTYIHEKRPSR